MRKLLAIAALLAAVYTLAPVATTASSHREAPLISNDPAADNTDLYAFVSPDRPGFVTFIANWAPFSAPDGGPTFYPFATDASYLINVDNNGDGDADARFRFQFSTIDKRGGSTFLYNNGPVTSLDDENLLFRQTYSIESSFNGAPFKTRVTGVPVAPSRVGPASMPDYGTLRQQATVTLPGGWRTFAGQADDPFFLDLRVFDLLYGGDLSEVGNDTLAGFNVNTIALEVPFKDVALNEDGAKNPVIGIWTTTERTKAQGNGTVQVSRLGNPLVNEVVVPAGLKDGFNASKPSQDSKNPQLVQRVTNPEVPALLEAIYKLPAPATPRDDLVAIFLTGLPDLNNLAANADINKAKIIPSEMLRLNLSTPQAAVPNRLGLLGGDNQGFPNGRRLTDDVVDIGLQALAGAARTGKLVDALAKGDAVDANDTTFSNTFPYVALPNTTRVAGAPGGPAASPSTAPASLSSMDTSDTVAVLSASAAGIMGLLLFAGWWRRRRSYS